jgi:glycine cleavage system regulatory protein
MHTELVITFSGPDTGGLIDKLSAKIRDHGGNWEESRLVRLAGRACGLLLVRVPLDHAEALEAGLKAVEGVHIHVERGETDDHETSLLRLSLTCSDRHGIVHDVSQALTAQGASIEELHSGVTRAPWSGEPLFKASVRVSLPPNVEESAVVAALEALQSDLLVERL